MGIFDKLERRLERGVNGAFARAFRSEVQPVEIASAMRRAMDDRAASAGKGKRLIVPNLFTIELSTTDFEALVGTHEAELADDLIATAAEHAESQRYQPGGPVSVQFSEDDSLETGVFRLRPSTARQVKSGAVPRRMPPARDYDDPRVPSGREPGGRPFPQQPPSPVSDRAETGDASRHYVETSDTGPAYNAVKPEREDYRPSPAAPRRLKQRPWLEIDGDRYPLIGAITVIGRDDDVDIVLDDPGISRRHSEIRLTYDGPHQILSIRDLGSTNGTYVNGDPVGSTHLHEGDRLTVGRTKMIVHEGGSR
ncbi:FhaA domain-containing protein [Flexivirga meconopsidis]|uniref:FhaA domain-containing protein n=1 Tax=Flexivirga meconopsidis TaxID=2977121 RepID=UPI00223F778B